MGKLDKKTPENPKANNLGEYLEKGGPGRKPGTPNKITGCMKAEAWKVFNALQNNIDEKGAPLPEEKRTSLAAVAKKDPVWFYSVFGAKMLPKDVNVRTIQSVEDLTDDERLALLDDLKQRIEGVK